MVVPCTVTDAGDSVRSLAKAYVADNGCIQQFQLLLKSQQDWKSQQLLIYKPK